jgi:hypothetical protein
VHSLFLNYALSFAILQGAYRTPDYGIWERGNKINHGQPELNSSSIGMAVAALQAISNVNLFGKNGGPASVSCASLFYYAAFAYSSVGYSCTSRRNYKKLYYSTFSTSSRVPLKGSRFCCSVSNNLPRFCSKRPRIDQSDPK